MHELIPMYQVGDRVLIRNPFDIFDDEFTKVYTVTHVKFSDVYHTHCYRLDDGTEWVNESWLEPDLFGPQFIDEEVVGMKKTDTSSKKALLAEQDYLLACLYDAMQAQDDEVITKDKVRLAEIHAELEAIK